MLALVNDGPDVVAEVIEAQADALTKPPMTVSEILDGLHRSG